MTEPAGTGLCCVVNRCHRLCLILPQLPVGFRDHFHCFAKHLKDANPLHSPEYGACIGFGASLGMQGCPQTGLCTLPVGISAEISASCTTYVANPMLFLSVSCQPRLAEWFVLSSCSQLLADTATTLSQVAVGSPERPTPGRTHPVPSQIHGAVPLQDPPCPRSLGGGRHLFCLSQAISGHSASPGEQRGRAPANLHDAPAR